MKSETQNGAARENGTARRYKVGIHKQYFPRDLWPTQIGEEFYEVTRIEANSRTAAAEAAWRKYGAAWLAKMLPQKTSSRRISLHVNAPDAGVGGKLGRLIPITVYDSKNQK